MMTHRRFFLQSTLGSGAIALAAGTGLLYPLQVLATQSPLWNSKAFSAKNLQAAIKSALDSDLTEASNKITIKAPDIAENGAVVPITVTSTLANVTSITLFSEKNSMPLVAKYDLHADTLAFIYTRVKMGQTANVIAIVSADGKNYSARKEVKITVGGCGG